MGQILYFRKMLKETNLEENMSSAKWKQLMRIYYDLLKNIWIIETYNKFYVNYTCRNRKNSF